MTLIKVGDEEFSVATGSLEQSSVTGLIGGGFVVTWSGQTEVYGQIFDATGEAIDDTPFRINTYTANTQWRSSVAALSNGGFVVTWDSYEQDGSSYGIYGQRYNSAGETVGNEFPINTHTPGYQEIPSVTGLVGGGFVVSWASYGQDGSDAGIFYRVYGEDGVALEENERQANSYVSSYQVYPSVAALSDGGFVITWASWNQDGSNYGIFGQMYHADGTANGNEFPVNTYTLNEQNEPSVAGFARGGFVVTWHSPTEDGSGRAIFARLYDADGMGGTAFEVASYDYLSFQSNSPPSVSALSDGGFVVTWVTKGGDSQGYEIYGRVYDEQGIAPDVPFPVNVSANPGRGYPSVAGLADGGFVVAWDYYGQGPGILGQRFSLGEANTPPQITSHGGGDSAAVLVAEDVAAVTIVSADDPDTGQTLTYSLAGGADEALFAINETTGALAFVSAPDFEVPNDADTDNVYEVIVQVEDGAGGVDAQVLAITIVDELILALDDVIGFKNRKQSVLVTRSESVGVLANDRAANPGDNLLVVAVDGAAENVGALVTGQYGVLELNADGSYSYAVEAGFSTPKGTVLVRDTFTYSLSDGTETDNATLTIAIFADKHYADPATLSGGNVLNEAILGLGETWGRLNCTGFVYSMSYQTSPAVAFFDPFLLQADWVGPYGADNKGPLLNTRNVSNENNPDFLVPISSDTVTTRPDVAGDGWYLVGDTAGNSTTVIDPNDPTTWPQPGDLFRAVIEGAAVAITHSGVVSAYDPVTNSIWLISNVNTGSAPDGLNAVISYDEFRFDDTDNSYRIVGPVAIYRLDSAAINTGDMIVGSSSPMLIDYLGGGLGDDVIRGGVGEDYLWGSSGNDRFVYMNPNEGGDHIWDFSTGDVIAISHTGFKKKLAIGGGNVGMLDPSHFVANTTGPTTPEEVFWFNTDSNTLYYDRDGSGRKGELIGIVVIENDYNVLSTDIQLI